MNTTYALNAEDFIEFDLFSGQLSPVTDVAETSGD
jgi:hypothetical protein